MGVTVLDVTVNWCPCLHASVCSTLVLKGLSCLLQPNSAGYLPVGFIVSRDQIREGVSGQGKGWLLVQGSQLFPPSSVWMQVGIAPNIG